MSESIDPKEYEKLYGSKLRPTFKKKDSTVDSILRGITKEEYDTLIDSLRNHQECFELDYAGTYPKGFGEAVIKGFTQTFASDEIFSQMYPEQKLNMFHNTNKFREEKMSEIKELGIEKDLFDDGILSSREMPPENVFSSLSKLINKPPIAPTSEPPAALTSEPPAALTSEPSAALTSEPSAAPTSTGIISTKRREEAARKGAADKKAPFKMKGGAWPVSSIFTAITDNEESMQLAAEASSTMGSQAGLSSAWITGAVSYSTLAIGFSITGIPLGVFIAYKLSCAIANMILERNGIIINRVVGDNETGPIEIIKKWFVKGKQVWNILGMKGRDPIPQMREMPAMPVYNGSILDYIGSSARNVAGRVGNVTGHMCNIIIKKMSQPGFALSSIFCTTGDLAFNLITGPFYGFAYLAKQMFGRRRNINAVNPLDVEPVNNQAEVNPLAPKNLSQRNTTPIDRYTKNIGIFSENITTLPKPVYDDANNQYLKLETKLNSIYKTCAVCTNHICNNGRYIQCGHCVNGVFHYDMIGGCEFSHRVCNSNISSENKNKCPTCRQPWKLCTVNNLSLLPEETVNKGFRVVDGPCLEPDSVALTDDEIIADNKILIGILDEHFAKELKTQIARELENELDHIVSATATKKPGDDVLDANVSTDVRRKPPSTITVGGSKKRKNKTKRRKNKKTRRSHR